MHRKKLQLLFIISFTLFILLISSASALAANPIPAGIGPYSVLANPVAHEIYVANIWSSDITVIDSLTDSVITTINVGNPSGFYVPVSLAHNPNTNKLYVVNFWGASLSVIDLPTYKLEKVIKISWSHSPARAVVVNPNTNLIYVTTLGQSPIGVIDGDPTSPTYNQVIDNIQAGSYSRSAAINTTLNRLYVVNTNSNNVSVVDIDSASPNFNQIIETIAVGNEPYSIAVNHTTGKVYVSNRRSNNISVIDGAINMVTATIPSGLYPSAIDINPARNQIFVANFMSGNVTVIDGSSDTVAATVNTGIKPYAVACIKTVNGETFVTNHGVGVPSTVTVIDPSFSTRQEAAGKYPAALAIDTLLPKPMVYVGNYGSNDVSVIDPPVGKNSLVTEINPLPDDKTTNRQPILTGESYSLSYPYPSKIMKVNFAMDSLKEKMKEAEILEGQGTPKVKWKIKIPEDLSSGHHKIYVVAMDMTGATISSTNGNVSGTPGTGMIASYDFDVVENSEDSTPPETIITSDGKKGFNNWYISDVKISLAAKDDSSGVVKTEYSFDNLNWHNYLEPVTLNTDGLKSFYFRSKDNAGNTESNKSVLYKIDKTPPSIRGTIKTKSNSNGWFNHNVTIGFSAYDNTSGLDNVSPDSVITKEGKNLSTSGMATDKAGNEAKIIIDGINIDKTPPLITIYKNSQPYLFGQPLYISYKIEDNLSGIWKKALTINGKSYQAGEKLNQAGENIFAINAQDYAGNKSSKTLRFLVTYFVDWQKPISFIKDKEVYEYTIVAGSTLPIKWKLRDYYGNVVQNSAQKIKVYNQFIPENFIVFTNGNKSDQIRFDPSSGQYIVNLHTKKYEWITPSPVFIYKIELLINSRNKEFRLSYFDPVNLKVVDKNNK